jgi:hypothetical protein
MWTWKPADGLLPEKDDPAREVRSAMRMMVILWLVRGMFTRDILYNPSFNIAFGLVVGLCILAETAQKGGGARPRAAS